MSALAAQAWLRTELSPDWITTSDITSEADQAGHSQRTVERALATLKESGEAESNRDGWRLAAETAPTPAVSCAPPDDPAAVERRERAQRKTLDQCLVAAAHSISQFPCGCSAGSARLIPTSANAAALVVDHSVGCALAGALRRELAAVGLELDS